MQISSVFSQIGFCTILIVVDNGLACVTCDSNGIVGLFVVYYLQMKERNENFNTGECVWQFRIDKCCECVLAFGGNAPQMFGMPCRTRMYAQRARSSMARKCLLNSRSRHSCRLVWAFFAHVIFCEDFIAFYLPHLHFSSVLDLCL